MYHLFNFDPYFGREVIKLYRDYLEKRGLIKKACPQPKLGVIPEVDAHLESSSVASSIVHRESCGVSLRDQIEELARQIRADGKKFKKEKSSAPKIVPPFPLNKLEKDAVKLGLLDPRTLKRIEVVEYDSTDDWEIADEYDDKTPHRLDFATRPFEFGHDKIVDFGKAKWYEEEQEN